MVAPVIHLFIPGPVIGKGRPRFSGNGRAYTPGRTRTWEGIARTVALETMRGKPPLRGPLSIFLEARFLPPASWPEWKRAAAIVGKIVPSSKPDPDNILKGVDAFNGVVWADDCQIVRVCVAKCYSERPGLDVIVQPLALAAAQITSRKQLEVPSVA